MCDVTDCVTQSVVPFRTRVDRHPPVRKWMETMMSDLVNRVSWRRVLLGEEVQLCARFWTRNVSGVPGGNFTKNVVPDPPPELGAILTNSDIPSRRPPKCQNLTFRNVRQPPRQMRFFHIQPHHYFGRKNLDVSPCFRREIFVFLGASKAGKQAFQGRILLGT